ncbi:MAG: SRPBCC domain-containing protein [Actinobacteria bacterium]|nr:SRPBCC domain-containing protein [Actinomycetota bacterium]MCA1722454.1 SRPBCC domain-containing protein [Actinomycetota bacterium]
MNDTAAGDLADVTYTRVFDAPRELVFACMTDPQHLTHFWGPTGVSTPLENITIDLRIGGRFDTTMVNDATGEEYPGSGVYTEIDPPATLAWREDSGLACRSTFTDLGGGKTEVTIVQMGVPAMYRSPEAQAGFESSLDRFAAYLQTQRS